MKILDCTLRDGGYYNNWDFEPEKAKQLIQALNRAGVEIIEVGYKTPLNQNNFYGLFRYCTESFLPYLNKDDKASYAFMIDVKQFLKEDGTIDEVLLNEVVLQSEESVFTWVRLASHYATINSIPVLVEYFRLKGYQVGFNLMGGSLLSNQQILEGLKIAEQSNVDVFYLADSFGSFYPDDIKELIKFAKANFSGKIGIHTHDNQGMAYANSLAAVEAGVDFVDGTVTGMGRGAGNLLTEQFLTGYAEKYNDKRYNGNALLKIIEDYVQPMKDHHKWGYSPGYMLSGLNNIHPTYCQNLIESNRFTAEEVSGILGQIPKENRSKFIPDALDLAIKKQLKQELKVEKGDSSKQFDISNLKNKTLIIVARGEQAKAHARNILNLSERIDAPVIECNETGYFSTEDKRYLAILNQVRLKNWLSNSGHYPKTTLISGFPVKEDIQGGHVPFKIGDFSVSQEKTAIPDYDAGLYAIALALKAGVKEILLAGFDGFEDQSLNRSKEVFFKQILKEADDAVIMHITPSKYTTFKQGSLYEFQ